jgi:acyl carrier protein
MNAVQKSIEDRVIAVVADQFGFAKEDITRETALVGNLGADSLDITELTMELEEEFSEGTFEMKIPDDVAEKLLTVGQIIDYITERLSRDFCQEV